LRDFFSHFYKHDYFAAIGDNDGHVGLGVKCSKEVATTIRGAIIMAKLSIIPVRRGFWGPKMGKSHTVPCGSIWALVHTFHPEYAKCITSSDGSSVPHLLATNSSTEGTMRVWDTSTEGTMRVWDTRQARTVYGRNATRQTPTSCIM
jgi:WD40 repeat protein